jgi:hypothetical protein
MRKAAAVIVLIGLTTISRAATTPQLQPAAALAELQRLCVDTLVEKQSFLHFMKVSELKGGTVRTSTAEMEASFDLSNDVKLVQAFERGKPIHRCLAIMFLADVPRTAQVLGSNFGIPTDWRSFNGDGSKRTYTVGANVVAKFDYTYSGDPSDTTGLVSIIVTPTIPVM